MYEYKMFFRKKLKKHLIYKKNIIEVFLYRIHKVNGHSPQF